MKSVLLIVLAVTFSVGVYASDSLHINYGGIARGFWVHVPPTYAPGQHLPVVFNFHGYGSYASQQELYTQMDNVADTGNFMVVYPSGVSAAWNVGWFGSFWTGPDDVGFTSAMIDTLIQLYAIDTTRVYSCGMSNGGFMSHLLASMLNRRIAAIASVAGTLTDSAVADCSLSRKVPVMDIHGTHDPVVPYDTFMASRNVEQTISFWVSHDLCSATSDTTFLPDINTSDSSTVQKIDYPSCAEGAEVLFYKIINGGHTWPNGIINIPVAQYGYTNRDIDANTEIWHFFNKYKINVATGLSELADWESDIHISPNPLSGQALQITCDGPLDFTRVQILDVNGRVVFTSEINKQNDAAKLDIPLTLSAGVYLVHLYSATSSVVKRLVKL